jgi:hypothetical protein
MQKRPSIRLLLAVTALSAAGIGCGDETHPIGPTSLSGDGAASAAAAGGVMETWFPVGPQLAAVRLATAAFHDPDVALAAGYRTDAANEPCVSSPDGAMGVHAPNFALIADPELDSTRPEALLYLPNANGKPRLIGVEYVRIVLLRNPQTNEVGPWLSEDPWPAGHEVVTPTPRLFGQTFQGPMPGHAPGMGWHWDLHAWVWAHDPSGMFAPWNPALECP